MKKICMVVQDPLVKGGIAAVVNGYRNSKLEKDYKIIYVESYKDGGKFTKLMKGISGYIRFAKVMLVEKPELVHIHSSFGPSFYRKIPFIYMASWAKVPIVNHIHGADFEEFYINATKKKRKRIQKVYGKCDKIIALSQEWKEKLSQIVSSDKIDIIENYSVLHEDALEERKNRNCNKNVLFLGELGHRKGCYDIPLVVKKVTEVIPDVKFVLCGSGSEADEDSIKKLIKEQGVSDNIEFPGWVRNAKKDTALREADLFFLPSYNEGMPMSILDAMGYGLPIISTNVGGIPKIVHDGKNGTCCEPGNINEFAESIIGFLADDKKRMQAAKVSIDIVKSNYSLEAHLELLENTYRSLI